MRFTSFAAPTILGELRRHFRDRVTAVRVPRRLQELYPDIKIKLFKRREIRDLMVKYGLMTEAQKLQGTAAQETSK